MTWAETPVVELAGLHLPLDSAWEVLSADSCKTGASVAPPRPVSHPTAFVGDSAALNDCLAEPTPDKVVAKFGHTGPPRTADADVAPTVPETIHGVRFEVAAAPAIDEGKSEALALLPNFDAWILVDVVGDPNVALSALRHVIATVDSPSTATTMPPIQASYVGDYFAHTSELRVMAQTITMATEAGCCGPEQVLTFAYRRSLDGTALVATLTKVDYFVDQQAAALPDHDPNLRALSVGDTFTFRFVAPGLMRVAIAQTRNPITDDLRRVRYFCGNGIADDMSYNCGA